MFQIIGLLIGLTIRLLVLMVRVLIWLLAFLFRLVALAVVEIGGWIEARGSRPRNAVIRPALSGDLRWEIFRRDGYRCMACGSHHDLTIDHVWPVSRGGLNDASNLRTLCRSCNSRKGALV
jgi:HNH endonuclease